jgi:hypothetical protein
MKEIDMERIMNLTIEVTIPAEYADKTTDEIALGIEQAIEEHTRLLVWITETTKPAKV